MKKTYLGDGVYVEFDGYGLVLTAENGISTTDTIVLEPHIFSALTAFVESLAPESETTNTEGRDL